MCECRSIVPVVWPYLGLALCGRPVALTAISGKPRHPGTIRSEKRSPEPLDCELAASPVGGERSARR